MNRGSGMDVVLAGVGGQGVLSAAAILSLAAREAGLQVRQGEVHGMSQRGGAVEAHLRIAGEPVASGLIPRHRADLILSLEPVEGLRYLEYLSAEGTLVTSVDPFENIPDYPDLDGVLDRIRSLPRSILIPARTLAREAGSANAVNVVMVGAASSFMPMDPCLIEEGVVALFSRKGEKVVKINLEAFRLGRSAATEALAASTATVAAGAEADLEAGSGDPA